MTEGNWSVIGIDLGTTYSCIGVWRNGRVEIVPNDQGNRTTPSCVAFTDGERLIGEGANNQVGRNASNTIFDVKRLMGRSFSDALVESNAKYWPFEVIADGNDRPLISVSYHGEKKDFSPEEISAMVLVKMKEAAEAYLGAGTTIAQAVVSVPAYFNGFQRQATMDAGVIAGLTPMRIINEPSASAIAYSLNRKWSGGDEKSRVVVYDLGGGTLDVSLVLITQGVSEVIATAGETNLGGEDFTNNMVDHFVEEFKKKNHKDIIDDKKALGRLRRSCEEAKRRLSTNPHTTVEVDALFEGIDFRSDITRDKFNGLNVDIFRRCMEPVEKCLVDAKINKKQVDDVVLVGGSTRIPHMREQLKRFFDVKELSRNINADEAIACGATVQAARLAMRRGFGTAMQTSCNLPLLIDIRPIVVLEGPMLELIERHTTIPTKMKSRSLVRVKEKSSVDPEKKVRFEIVEDGMLQVSVWAQHKGGWETITNLFGRFHRDEIKRMVNEAKEYKEKDEEYRNNVQARNDIENLFFHIMNNMKALEESPARLLLKETREHELQDTRTRKSMSDVEKKKLIQAHKGTINKLNNNIKQLRKTVDVTTKDLERMKLTTDNIICQMTKIKDDYNNISSQIENIQARKNIVKLLFTVSNTIFSREISNTMKATSLKDMPKESAASSGIPLKATREKEEETAVLQDSDSMSSGFADFNLQNAQDMDNAKITDMNNSIIENIEERSNQLHEYVDQATKFLIETEPTTIAIINMQNEIEDFYKSIKSQIENAQARRDIEDILVTISNNEKNLKDSAGKLPQQQVPPEQFWHFSKLPRYLSLNSTKNQHNERIKAQTDTGNELLDSINELLMKPDSVRKWLENMELNTNQIIVVREQMEGDYNSIISRIDSASI